MTRSTVLRDTFLFPNYYIFGNKHRVYRKTRMCLLENRISFTLGEGGVGDEQDTGGASELTIS